ncbi:uncharacterized protein LOC110931717 [Helianthus annuus]|uniref:uncharacterized protein LOC110931717 n=1 Tax=Helianthus annuus TaxID=4232 RepID=UPI000B90144C|nr:uncharacterized protein LOC110931717 [Helianthus annuus]
MSPIMGKYDGTSDPDDHINLYRSAGEVALWPMPLWCNMFVQSLVGSARVWWDSLPVGAIDSFEELVTKFLQQFSQQRRHTKDRNEVLHIHRRDNETVENFLTIFNKESLAIPGLTQELACGAFLQGVNDDELLRKLHDRNGVPDTIEEIMRITKIYVCQEKSIIASHAANKKKESYRPSEESDRRGSKIKSQSGRFSRGTHA